MRVLRSAVAGGSLRRPALLVFGLMMMVIVGLIAMHVLNVSGPHGHSSPAIPITAVATDEVSSAGMSGASMASVAHCAGCDETTPNHSTLPSHSMSPDHSMLMMACILALLVGVLLLLVPRLVNRGRLTWVLAFRELSPVGAVLQYVCPPSLIFLSISRI